MFISPYPWTGALLRSLDQEPTMGRLLDLCEENYQALLTLFPELPEHKGEFESHLPGQAHLKLTVLEQSKYTSLINLTYAFDDGRESDPDAVLRVYHDAEQVEVEQVRQSNLPELSLYEAPGLVNKWRANIFVGKWLRFCVNQGHFFTSRQSQKVAEVATI
jgi:uncharacterized protein YqiB (DUF1249 family)